MMFKAYPNRSAEAYNSMPHCQYNPFPKYFEVEVYTLLAGFVQLRVLVDILVVHVLRKVTMFATVIRKQ
jgi:hypothetical protein